MYKIDRKTTKPDIGWMQSTLKRLMSNRGIKVKIDNETLAYYEDTAEKLKKEIYEKYGIVNINSTKQVSEFLQEQAAKFDLGVKNDIIDVCYDPEKEKWTTGKEALRTLADLGYEFAIDIMDYRDIEKHAEVLKQFRNLADENSTVHPDVVVGKTNRINYSRPGLMTIHKEMLWDLVKPYKDGNKLYSVDIKNQEPAILINMTGSDELKPALTSPEGLYEYMFKKCFRPYCIANVLVDTLPEERVYTPVELAKINTISPAYYMSDKPPIDGLYYKGSKVIGISKICIGSHKGNKPELPKTISIETENEEIYDVNVTWETEVIDKRYNKDADYEVKGYLDDLEIQISPIERKEFKVAWLAITYGSSSYGIQRQCNNIDGKRVYEYITKTNGMKEYRSLIDKKVKNNDPSICTIFGTPLVADQNWDKKALKRTLLNIPIQGSAADILSLLMKRLEDYKAENNLDDKIELYFTRHDELILEIDKDWHEEVGEEKVKDILTDIFEHQIDDWTPFRIEVSKVSE